MKKFAGLNRKGFTLIEVIVVAAIIAILAGILVPMIFNQIDESKKTRAAGDCKSLQQAVASVRSNTLRWPTYSITADPCVEDVGYYIKDTTVPPTLAAGIPIPTGTAVGMYDVLGAPKDNAAGTVGACYSKVDNPSVSAWAGPYITQESGMDPWGHSYIIYVDNLKTASATKYGWVISTGPDGVLDTDITNPNMKNTEKDDVGIRFEE